MRPGWHATLAALMLTAGCATAHADSNFSRLVDIGGGRSLFLDCQGAGSPTVFVIPGKGSYAQAWNYVVPADDPIRSSPYDLIAQADLQPSPDAAQPTVARTTRVCVYDRPNTRPDGTDLSTPTVQPHSLVADVDDVVALISAANLGAPLVIVAHSYGGLIADLLARTHPELVSGLVMVDPVSEFLPALGTSEQNAAFFRDGAVPPQPGDEAVLYEEAFADIAAAPALPDVPTLVLSSGKFVAPEQLTPENYTQAQIHQANTLLADALSTSNTVIPSAGHNVMLYEPKAVADSITGVVTQVSQ